MAFIGLAIISRTSSQRLIALWLSPYLYAHDLYGGAHRDRRAHHVHGAYGVSCRTMPNPKPVWGLTVVSTCGRTSFIPHPKHDWKNSKEILRLAGAAAQEIMALRCFMWVS